MLELAIFIGLYTYILFFLGITGLFFTENIILISLIYFLTIICIYRKTINFNIKPLKFDNLSKAIISLLIIQVFVNLIGVLGPEISFDALWYHLTIPKLFLQNHIIYHIPGNLLYYSDMPKLTEMLYSFGLTIGNEIIPKLIHFTFGILTLLVIFKLSRKFTSVSLSLIACLIFYSNLVVGWESITAYVDLSRAFFEFMGFWAFLNWFETKKTKWIVILGIMIGFAVSVKVISVSSIIIYILLFFILYIQKYKERTKILRSFLLFVLISIAVSLPWFVFSYLNTGNPFFPLFSSFLPEAIILPSFDIFNLPKNIYNLFLNLNDPISPIFIIFVPIIVISFKYFSNKIKLISFYVFISLIVWYFTQQIGGGRFVLPYLPVFSVLCALAINKLKSVTLKIYLITLIILISFISIGYRGIANAKFIPVILGQETKSEFLSKHLNFSFGDFYDTDNYFKTHIKQSDKVLLFGFHNLYYVDFPYIDSSWVRTGDRFNYIAVQNSEIPSRFSNWKLIYYNKLTKVKLYSEERKIWIY